MARRPTYLGACALLCALLAGCTAMVGSVSFDGESHRSGLACSSSLGAYSLPRRQIKVQVTNENNNSPYGINASEGSYIPDPQHVYCLDFLASLVADERIGIQRSTDNRLLLQRV